MDELKPQESEALDILEAMLDAADVESTTHTGVTNWDKPVRSGNCRILADDATKLREYIADRRAAPENKALTLEELRKMKVPCPLYEEETPSGDITESRIGPVLFTGIHSGNEERACWITSEAHRANARTEYILAGKINFYARKPEGSAAP